MKKKWNKSLTKTNWSRLVLFFGDVMNSKGEIYKPILTLSLYISPKSN